MKVREIIHASLKSAIAELDMGDAGVSIVLERPRDPSHGDMSTPVAMSLAKKLRRNPAEIAESIAGKLSLPADSVVGCEVLKPGFINFRFSIDLLRKNLPVITSERERFGASDVGVGRKVQVEYVSANPTGPLVIVSARAAAIGSVLVNLLEFEGFEAEGEYYVNDHGKQIESLGESLRFRLRERLGVDLAGQEIGQYPGAYLAEVAGRVEDPVAREWVEGSESAETLGRYAGECLLEGIRSDLDAYGARFHSFFHESALHPDATDAVFKRIQEAGYVFEQDGAVFFRTTDLGDDKDRVLKKANGESTYFLSDIAYHHSKLDRGFETAVELLGPDHHGHVPRMKAAMSVLGAPPDWLDVIIVGWVRLMEDGKPISMSKRAGEFVTMRELMDDVGADVAKYFFLMRRAHSPLDFDLTLARKQSDENPVYYVQYAHARISSVIRFAKEKGQGGAAGAADLSRLDAKEERALMLQLLYFPHVVESATASREPNRLTAYAQETANAFHQFYHECRIVTDDPKLTSARLLLAEATMQVLRNTLGILGVNAPSSM